MNIETHPIPRDLLSLLRVVESTPDGDLEWAEHCTRQQAVILSLQVPELRNHPVTLSALEQALGILIDLDDRIPIAATAFPTAGGWRMRISASLTPTAQLRAALHELKHVIDYPMRSRDGAAGLSAADYEHLADYFADYTLTELGP